MKTKRCIAAVLSFAITTWALAQERDAVEEGNLDLTITVMPEDAELPGVVTGEITLPLDDAGEEAPADSGVDNSVEGLGIANEARAEGQAVGEAAAAAAEASREQFGRGTLPDLENLIPENPSPDELLPDGLPDTPVDVPVPADP